VSGVVPPAVAGLAGQLRVARRVVIVPGYGVAVAQAQHALANLASVLGRGGTEVTFAVHPVAGRMPGQLNVLLDGAGVAWGDLRDLDGAEFAGADVALVVGANDVVNPRLGIPVFEVTRAGRVVVLIDSTRPGYAGIDNPLFDSDVEVLRGDALALLRETEEAIARIPQPGDDVAELVQPVLRPGDEDGD
jgi:NAD(P) transhydrogenase subunit beta